jgi:hypothetical protein
MPDIRASPRNLRDGSAGGLTAVWSSPAAPETVSNLYPSDLSFGISASRASTVCCLSPPESWNRITAPSPPRGIALLTMASTPGRSQS